MESINNRACIVCVGHTEYSKDFGRSELKLAWMTIGSSIEDADIDAIVKYAMNNDDPIDIARKQCIACLRFFGEVDYGGGGGPWVANL
ncbi:MAG: hypothetical protein ACI915_004727 [Gammaproteobacteria bacterium]|jgi:hypothetical protein